MASSLYETRLQGIMVVVFTSRPRSFQAHTLTDHGLSFKDLIGFNERQTNKHRSCLV